MFVIECIECNQRNEEVSTSLLDIHSHKTVFFNTLYIF